MKTNWNVTKLLAVVSLAVLNVVVILAASVLTVASGVPMASGAIVIITEPLIFIACLLIVDEPGTAILFKTIEGVLTLPFAYSGPPGFLPKVAIIICLGLIVEFLFAGSKRISKLFAALVISGFEPLWYTFVVIAVGRFFNVPNIDKVLTYLPLTMLVIALVVVGWVGGLLGLAVYNRLKNTAVVTRIHGE